MSLIHMDGPALLGTLALLIIAIICIAALINDQHDGGNDHDV